MRLRVSIRNQQQDKLVYNATAYIFNLQHIKFMRKLQPRSQVASKPLRIQKF